MPIPYREEDVDHMKQASGSSQTNATSVITSAILAFTWWSQRYGEVTEASLVMLEKDGVKKRCEAALAGVSETVEVTDEYLKHFRSTCVDVATLVGFVSGALDKLHGSVKGATQCIWNVLKRAKVNHQLLGNLKTFQEALTDVSLALPHDKVVHGVTHECCDLLRTATSTAKSEPLSSLCDALVSAAGSSPLWRIVY